MYTPYFIIIIFLIMLCKYTLNIYIYFFFSDLGKIVYGGKKKTHVVPYLYFWPKKHKNGLEQHEGQ